MALPPEQPVIPSEHPIIALCRWLPYGGDAGNIPTDPDDPMPENPDTDTDWVFLGVDDCWLEVTKEPGLRTVTVHCQFVGRDGEPFYITGDERAVAEVYIRDLAETLGVHELRQIATVDGIPIYTRASSTHLPGLLINPFTKFISGSVANRYVLYPVSVKHTDEGGRYYGFDVVFQEIMLSDSGTKTWMPEFTWEPDGGDPIPLGNLPGTWMQEPDHYHVRYVVKTAWRFISQDEADEINVEYPGDDIEVYLGEQYVAYLADSLGLDAVYPIEFPRGSPGSRGDVKTFNQTPGNLSWVRKGVSVASIYPESISGNVRDDGVIDLTITFVKGR